MKATASFGRAWLAACLGLSLGAAAPALAHPVRSGHPSPIGSLLELVLGAVFADEIARHEASHPHEHYPEERWCEEHQQWEPVEAPYETAEAPPPEPLPAPEPERRTEWTTAEDPEAESDPEPAYDEGPTPPGVVVEPPDVLFDPGSSTLSRGAKSRLQRFADGVRARHDLEVVLRGHTDGSSDEADAFTLSEQRAYVVRSFLVEEGVPWRRVRIVGFGAARPVASNDTAAGRQRNRRVEIVLREAEAG